MRIVILALGMGILMGCVSQRGEPPTLPQPEPIIELLNVQARTGFVRIDWRVSNGGGRSFEVQRRVGQWPWKVRAVLAPSPSGILSLEDGTVSPGVAYGFRIRVPYRGGGHVYAGAVTVEMPGR